MKRILAPMLLVLALSGCASAEAWSRPGTPQATAEADMRTCRASTGQTGYSGLAQQVAGYNLFHRCMAERGYHASLY